MTITFPSDTRDTINDIRNAIGRTVTFYREYEQDCPACTIDPVTNTSVNPYCIVCSGLGYLYTYSGFGITGHITWSPSETMNWVTGGQFIEGDCRVQIEHTAANITIVDNTDYVMIDGRKFKINKKMYRGVPELNRILIDLTEDEE